MYSITANLVRAVIAAAGIVLTGTGAGTAPPPQPEASAVLAPAGVLTGAPVDGIGSGPMEHMLFHIHAHVQLYVDGRQRLLPYGIGIVGPYRFDSTPDGPFVTGGTAFYWMHTHDLTGLIHLEAPVQRTFTLGDLFDMWGQPLTADQVGPAHGPVIAMVDGRRHGGDPRMIRLGAHSAIQLDVGTFVSFQPYTFAAGY